jgi:hypothetical protein
VDTHTHTHTYIYELRAIANQKIHLNASWKAQHTLLLRFNQSVGRKNILKISNTTTIKITGSNGFITTETIYLFKKI